MKNTKELRELVERSCRIYVSTAAWGIDINKESPVSAYGWAYNKLDGMANAYLTIYEFDLYDLVIYYRDIASRKFYGF